MKPATLIGEGLQALTMARTPLPRRESPSVALAGNPRQVWGGFRARVVPCDPRPSNRRGEIGKNKNKNKKEKFEKILKKITKIIHGDCRSRLLEEYISKS